MSWEVPLIILVIAILIYIVSMWLLKRFNSGNSQNRKYIAIIPAVILSPIVYIGLIIIWICYASYYPQETFSKEKWNANVEKRYSMSRNIIKSDMLIGKTKEEIVTLLGDDYHEYSKDHIGYYLGFVPKIMGIDPDILDIYFEENKVIKVSQHES